MCACEYHISGIKVVIGTQSPDLWIQTWLQMNTIKNWRPVFLGDTTEYKPDRSLYISNDSSKILIIFYIIG